MIKQIELVKSTWNNFYDVCHVTYESGAKRTFMRGCNGFSRKVREFMEMHHAELEFRKEEAYPVECYR